MTLSVKITVSAGDFTRRQGEQTEPGLKTAEAKILNSLTFAAMIAYVKGDFVLKTPATVHVDVNGLGYEIQISLNTYSSIQSLTKGLLHTFLHIKEDGHTLYGFFMSLRKKICLSN